MRFCLATLLLFAAIPVLAVTAKQPANPYLEFDGEGVTWPGGRPALKFSQERIVFDNFPMVESRLSGEIDLVLPDMADFVHAPASHPRYSASFIDRRVPSAIFGVTVFRGGEFVAGVTQGGLMAYAKGLLENAPQNHTVTILHGPDQPAPNRYYPLSRENLVVHYRVENNLTGDAREHLESFTAANGRILVFSIEADAKQFGHFRKRFDSIVARAHFGD